MTDLPGYVWVLVLIGLTAFSIATGVALHRGAVSAGYELRTVALAVGAVGAIWGGWLLVVAVLADAGAFRGDDPSRFQPWLPAAAFGTLVVLLAAARIPAVARSLATPTARVWLTAVQTARALGVVFLVVLAMDRLPAAFAVPAGLGDIAVGLAAPWVALRVARGTHRRGVIWFNLLGILDLIIAGALGFLAGAGPGAVLDVEPSTRLLVELPLCLIPTTVVPLAIALHVVSLRALRNTADGQAADRRPAVTVPTG